MPYKVAKVKGGFKVQTKAGPHKGNMHSKAPMSYKMASRQMRAMYANTKGK